MLQKKIGDRKNLKVIQKAILDPELIPQSGYTAFNVMKNSELSTFLDVNPKIDNNLWRDYLESLEISQQILVECMTLEQLINEHKILKVDFLKIDTQGTDLGVLLSAGSQMKKIMSCVLEFPYSKESAIYADEISLLQGIDILGDYGFIPMRIVPNSYGECNVFFRASNYSTEEYFQMEQDLNFNKAPTLKIGTQSSFRNMSQLEKFTYFLKCIAVVFLTKLGFRRKTNT
jgi:FkbM family methyltransferase